MLLNNFNIISSIYTIYYGVKMLLRKIYSVAAVACGTIVFYFVDGIYENVTALQATSVGTGAETMKMTITAGQLLANKEMYLINKPFP